MTRILFVSDCALSKASSAGEVRIDYGTNILECNGTTIREGEPISINGTTGEVFAGAIASADSELKQVLIGKTLKTVEAVYSKAPFFKTYFPEIKKKIEAHTLLAPLNIDLIRFFAEVFGIKTHHLKQQSASRVRVIVFGNDLHFAGV